MERIKIIIMGAAGRDFHNFNTFYRDNDRFEVVAFTATQIPNIDGRKYPAELSGKLYPDGIDIFPEEDLLDIIAENNYSVKQNYSYPSAGRKAIDFMFSKGCFRKCDFCVAGGQKGNHVTATEYDLVDKQLADFTLKAIEELIIQDDLSGLEVFNMMAQGHVVEVD